MVKLLGMPLPAAKVLMLSMCFGSPSYLLTEIIKNEALQKVFYLSFGEGHWFI